MQSLRETSIAQIKSVPGLFISDRFAARSLSLLKSLNIKYILSVTRPEDRPKFDPKDHAESDVHVNSDRFVTRHVDINDDPTEDILLHLKDTCDWIEASLLSTSSDIGRQNRTAGKAGVLVHCTQGISRSGSIVIAYLMRKFSLDYPAALALVRESRALVSPNPGFEAQLRIWRSCAYDVYLSHDYFAAGSAALEEKDVYRSWKSARDAMLKADGAEEKLNKARFASMAIMAAKFGKKRAQDNEEGTNSDYLGIGKSVAGEKEKAWKNVEKMEEEWTRRLITGDYSIPD
ncbi:Dual specificity phosphatase MPK-4 [Hyphodiscus hymeniophilus]|uniref:protein-tyrosine-phosphatase n=1 Tax=Hyphodiscus hymeniophilus TaxID=353542 RepID=A0A9P6VFM6_9HELO|nr:Dual specificity phosphatase MPK-4 [Hyphodiscus hymeniophilus]